MIRINLSRSIRPRIQLNPGRIRASNQGNQRGNRRGNRYIRGNPCSRNIRDSLLFNQTRHSRRNHSIQDSHNIPGSRDSRNIQDNHNIQPSRDNRNIQGNLCNLLIRCRRHRERLQVRPIHSSRASPITQTSRSIPATAHRRAGFRAVLPAPASRIKPRASSTPS